MVLDSMHAQILAYIFYFANTNFSHAVYRVVPFCYQNKQLSSLYTMLTNFVLPMEQTSFQKHWRKNWIFTNNFDKNNVSEG